MNPTRLLQIRSTPMTHTISHDGKVYRCVRLPDSAHDKGGWEFFYNGQWRKVINYQICFELNMKLKSQPTNDQLTLF